MLTHWWCFCKLVILITHDVNLNVTKKTAENDATKMKKTREIEIEKQVIN